MGTNINILSNILMYNIQIKEIILDLSGQYPQSETMDDINYSRLLYKIRYKKMTLTTILSIAKVWIHC